jgi:Holliday junction resolvasome RuvABC endonuclease subunit
MLLAVQPSGRAGTKADGRGDGQMVMPAAGDPVLLAVDAGVWQTGWALFLGEAVAATGLLEPASRGQGLCLEDRLARLQAGLDQLVDDWRPRAVVLTRPSGLHHWPAPAVDALLAALDGWRLRRGLPMHRYSDLEVRRAVVGSERASGSQLAFAIMALLGFVGQSRTTKEWEAVAAGYYHLARQG